MKVKISLGENKIFVLWNCRSKFFGWKLKLKGKISFGENENEKFLVVIVSENFVR